jgi:hypothetical protein
MEGVKAYEDLHRYMDFYTHRDACRMVSIRHSEILHERIIRWLMMLRKNLSEFVITTIKILCKNASVL